MAIGDQNDMFARLKSNIVNWFGTNTPNLDALLQGTAFTDSFVYGLINYVNNQTRLSSSTDINVDLFAQDFFGNFLPRRAGENDPSYIARISANLFQEKATRNGMIQVLTKLTGHAPIIIEGFDTTYGGCFDQNLYFDQNGGFGFLQPYTAIIYAFRPTPAGISSYAGFDNGFGYDFHYTNAYADISGDIIIVSDDDILFAIENTKVYGTLMIVYILDPNQPNSFDLNVVIFNDDFVTDVDGNFVVIAPT